MTGTEVTATLSVFEGREPPPEPAGEEAAQGDGRDGGGQQGGGSADPDGALQRSGLSGDGSGDGESGAPVDGDARVATEAHHDTESSREDLQPELVVLRRDDVPSLVVAGERRTHRFAGLGVGMCSPHHKDPSLL